MLSRVTKLFGWLSSVLVQQIKWPAQSDVLLQGFPVHVGAPSRQYSISTPSVEVSSKHPYFGMNFNHPSFRDDRHHPQIVGRLIVLPIVSPARRVPFQGRRHRQVDGHFAHSTMTGPTALRFAER